jgi:hypothetical protein
VSAAQHTPGPWSHEPEEHNGEPAEAPRFFTIHGPMYFADVHVLTSHEDHSIAEANARLIASAPDMRAALMVCRDYLSPRRADPMAAAALDVVNGALSLTERGQ